MLIYETPQQKFNKKTKFKDIHNILQQTGYQTIKSIGKGAFGEVLVAKNLRDASLYAIKVMNKILLKSQPFLRKYITQEINVMKKLNHLNIVRLIDSFQTNDFIILIMEYCKEGNLLSYQASLTGRAFEINHALRVIVQVLKGLKYIHQNGFIHRDIKSQNILLKLQQGNSYNLSYKIADFGFARPIGKIGARTQCGTQKYMAPQIINHQAYGISVDLWALGVVLYFMLFTQYPFQGHDMKSDISRKCSPYFNLSAVVRKKQKLANIPQQIADFFKKIFIVDHRRRICFYQLLSHPLFSSFRNQFADYELVYYQLQKNQKFVKDQAQKIIHYQHQSEAEPQDESRAVLLHKMSDNSSNQNTRHLNPYLQQIDFQIKKVLYLKQCAIEMYENYSTHLTYAERLGSKFYLLRAFLFFGQPLLHKLQQKQMPEGLSQIYITRQIWEECTRTDQYRKMVMKLQDQHLKNVFAYEDTYVLIQNIINQMPIKGFQKGYHLQITEKDFNEFKFGYRTVTVHLFKVIQNSKNINPHLQNKIKMRIFCCHMIKRIFKRSDIKRNFPYFVEWLKAKRIKYEHTFDFTYFKRWILQEQSQNLSKNIKLLHQML